MAGKGDKPRPLAIKQEDFYDNWDKIFDKRISEHEQDTTINSDPDVTSNASTRES